MNAKVETGDNFPIDLLQCKNESFAWKNSVKNVFTVKDDVVK
jgi:hypothetical protein